MNQLPFNDTLLAIHEPLVLSQYLRNSPFYPKVPLDFAFIEDLAHTLLNSMSVTADET